MMSLHSPMHSSQMYTVGPAISFLTSFCALPQNEHVRLAPSRFSIGGIANSQPSADSTTRLYWKPRYTHADALQVDCAAQALEARYQRLHNRAMSRAVI